MLAKFYTQKKKRQGIKFTIEAKVAPQPNLSIKKKQPKGLQTD
jgi:hypothetical protein